MRDIVHIGLDVGSTTVKIVILDREKNYCTTSIRGTT